MVELTTIQKAVEYCSTNLVNRAIHIIGDFLYPLTSIITGSKDKTWSSLIIVNLRRDINIHNWIKLFWTRVHVGNLDSERDDDLAKVTTLRDNIDLNYHPNKRYTKKSLHTVHTST